MENQYEPKSARQIQSEITELEDKIKKSRASLELLKKQRSYLKSWRNSIGALRRYLTYNTVFTIGRVGMKVLSLSSVEKRDEVTGKNVIVDAHCVLVTRGGVVIGSSVTSAVSNDPMCLTTSIVEWEPKYVKSYEGDIDKVFAEEVSSEEVSATSVSQCAEEARVEEDTSMTQTASSGIISEYPF